MGRIIGIDLGTTQTRAAVLINGTPVVITNSKGAQSIPSFVSFTDAGKRLIGQPAKQQMISNPEQTICVPKRLIGRRFDCRTVQSDIDYLCFKLSERKNGRVNIEVGAKSYSPAEISAFILQEMKQTAQEFLGEKVTGAVITVPAYFDDAQRQATMHAGEIAGLKVRRIINEPTAAALAFSQGKKRKKQIAVFDLGGGTLDISIFEIGGGVLEAKSTNGDSHLGGEDFDLRIVDYLAEEYQKITGIDLRTDKSALQILKQAAEKAKIELSSSLETRVQLPLSTTDSSRTEEIKITLSRSRYEEMVDDLMQKCLGPMKAVLRDAGLVASDIKEIILIGGMTQTPKIAQIVEDFFGRKPRKGKKNDEIVVAGAAIQAGVLTGEIKDMLLLDINAFSLGIEIQGGRMNRLIERNSLIPARKSRVFSTGSNNQTTLSIHVLEGENKLADDNNTLGRFELTDIPPEPRGAPRIEVTLNIDSNGIVEVSATDQDTGKKQKIKEISPTDLSKAEIKQMIRDAKKFAVVERKRG